MNHELRPYQTDCIDRILEDEHETTLANLFCGLGKSLIMDELLSRCFNKGIQFVVMPNLSLVRQFCANYLVKRQARYMVFCSLEDTDGVNEATTDEAEAIKFVQGCDGVIATTYISLNKLVDSMGERQAVSCAIFDESHHLQRENNEWALTCPAFQRRLLFSATPSPNNGVPVFTYSYAEALENEDEWGQPLPYSQDVRLHVGTFDGSAGAVAPHDNIELLINTALKTENMRCLSFHSNVNGEDPDSVKNFAQRCQIQLPILARGIKWRVETLDATTNPRDRVRILDEFDATPDNEIFILCSCETISEGVDTKRCNLVAFITPVRSYYKIVQKFGRAVRLQSHDRPATILLPFWVDPAQFTETMSKEERDAVPRTVYAKGNPLFDFYAAVREGDPELLELFQNMYRGPQTKRLKHYAELCGDRPRLSWEEAVQEATGVETDDIATAARESNTTVEVHPRNGPVEQHEGAAAVEKSIVEMEKDRFVVVPKNIAPAPRENRVVYDTCSPVLMNVNFNEELGTAVLEYEMRPGHFEQRIDEVDAFYKEHGEPPKRFGKRGNEATLAEWIIHCRVTKRKGTLTPERIQRIETVFKEWWSWNLRDDAFEDKIQEVDVFYKKYAEPPKKRKKRGNEFSLYCWVESRRCDKRKNILTDERIQRIETVFKTWWSWDPSDSALFENKIQEVDAFYKEHGELPKYKGKRGNEGSLWTWILNRRKDKRKGILTAENIQRIETVFKHWWSWDPYDDAFGDKIQEVDDFHDKYGELPKYKGKRENEGSLWTWIQKCRRQKVKGILTSERIQQIEMVFKDWWSWDPSDDEFKNKIQEVDAFYKRYGEVPKQQGERGNEASLATWIQNRRKNKKKGILTPEKIQRIETVFKDWWSWGKTSASASASMDEDTASITEDGADSSLDSVDFAPPAEPKTEERTPREKRPRDDGLDGMDKDALIAMIREKRGREGGGYTAPNPVNKDEINQLFSRSLPRHCGAVLFLDHTDFKTAHALQAAGVDPRDMIIPQRDRATYDIMRRDPVFGACLAFGDFNEILSQHTMSVRGIYADFTGSFSVAEGFVEACRDIHFLPQAVVAVTISLRNPDGTDHLYQDVGRLIGLLNLHLDTVVISDPATGKTIPSMVYGNGAPMATVIQRRRN
jgi:superfamily II DNA or RNA helicase